MSFLRKNSSLITIILSAVLLVIGMILQYFLSAEYYVFLSYFTVIFVICGHKPIINAIKTIFRGELLDENFLMTIAGIGALAIGKYSEAVAVMLFYNIGEFFEHKALNKSRKQVLEASNIREEFANKIDGENIVKVQSKNLKVGDIIIVKAGEKIAVDGVVLEGVSTVDLSIISGESLPKDINVGDNVASGSINLSGVIKIKVTKIESESTAAKIVELIEDASISKSKSEKFISKFAKIYTPIVVIIALIIAVIPPIFDGLWSSWVYRALSLLVISCPCAIVISVPLAFFGAVGSASKGGILIKGGGYLEKLNKVDTFVFDKTGTLTKGNFAVNKIEYFIDKEEFLHIIASIESYSNHPLSNAITTKYNKYIQKNLLNSVEEIAGKGIIAKYNNSDIIVGKYEFLIEKGVKFDKINEIGSIVYLAKDKDLIGYIVLKDELKESSKNLIKYLKKQGKNTVILTGDSKDVAIEIKEELGVDRVEYNLLPKDKLAIVDGLITSGKKVCFVGDGINDAPVLKRADVSIAMGKSGSDIAVDSADIILLNDDLKNVESLIKLSNKTINIVLQNIIIPLLIKLIVIILSALGITSMWLAIFSEVGVLVLAIANSIRLLNCKIK